MTRCEPRQVLQRGAPLYALVLEHDGQPYAIDAQVVRRIAWLPQLAAVEEMPPYVLGVARLGERMVPVIDLNQRFGYPSSECHLSDCIVVIETAAGLVGILAQRVLDAQLGSFLPFENAAGQIADAEEKRHRALLGSLDVGGTTAMLLAPEAIFPADQRGLQAVEPRAQRLFFPEASPAQRNELERRAVSLRAETDAQPVVRRGYAVVALGGEQFGIDLAAVREFAVPRDITPVPCCPPHIVGNMVLRGDIVTVVDISGLLGAALSRRGKLSRLVVAARHEQLIGVPVDEVLDVLYLDSSAFKDLPVALRGSEYLVAEAAFDGGMVAMLDLPRILDSEILVVNEGG